MWNHKWKKKMRAKGSLDGRNLDAAAPLLWGGGGGPRRRVILARAAAAEMSPLHELGVVHHPEGAEVILVPHETFVQRQVRPDRIL